MNIVDSSGWLEYFSGGRNADHFAAPLEAAQSLVVPVISIYEVFKVLLREASENAALQGAMVMQRAHAVVDMTPRLAISAASLGLEYSLPMADSIILASAHAYKATLWTQDIDFKGIDNVNYFPKSS
uniref:Predicted nucleic acid-binding protein, contains PIN domain n=1 Tax=Candidatus Kentrum sp. TUN TaxID=2126343 RepID=A0A451A9C6_9GAMM|nr:MAG: Predicted nucleic acid-binding protein, contains PIN domain [Candidatus Kentron sp. TUN]VFK62619.1 MAG: Predicted nucleic acid-binding protein, contains PIN domain [Candidatus Kentron sp. TUN]VFK71642.1 MAG: Predicted nucleic acid-binding protein, contains PIN domain [Candidatus Kentron sp. TUN]